MRTAFSVFALMGIISSAHAAVDLETALSKVRASCGGISEELNTMKTLAGIGTAVSAVGTVAGGAAVATGVMKNNTDLEIAAKMEELRNKQLIGNDGGWKRIEPDYVEKAWNEFKNSDEGSVLNKKSETLGNIRTGTLAATTATNIAGAAVGGVNMKKARGSLSEQVSECLASVKELSAAYGQARISRTASDEDLGRIETIVRVCDEWSTVDLSKIDNRATGAFASSVVGAATGAAGTITSALANSNGVRDGDPIKEKNLNTASNVLAGGATVASGAATIFNATQISVIKRASTVADACEGALK
ncbi:MAG: hypothetical protein J6R22_03640 [Alphaproteobacteria bacterium]|nr:hypothetical protein [Alphaproteobacteria bacterium]